MTIYVVYGYDYGDLYIHAYRDRVDAENALVECQEEDLDFDYHIKEVDLW